MGTLRVFVFCVAVAGSYCQITVSSSCRDELPDCYQYTKAACKSPYQSWAKKNCALYCGFCRKPCADTISDCHEYGKQACEGQYKTWASQHCASYCGMCSQTTHAPVVSGIKNNTRCLYKNEWHEPGSTWKDGCDYNCTCLGDGYSRCSSLCPTFLNLPTQCRYIKESGKCCPKLQCDDSGNFTFGGSNGCHYKGQTYAQGQNWTDGCSYSCTCLNGGTGYYRCKSICQTFASLSPNCYVVKRAGKCCSEVVCDAPVANQTHVLGDERCHYNNHTYNVGDTWNDGCTWKCKCRGIVRGISTCESRCVKFTLPKECRMEDPAPGKCCKVPRCPSGYIINYPDGYVEE